jgi:RNA 2',3'-cyclic 3'-phosphodiesterase
MADRLFFALWPGEDTRQALAERAARIQAAATDGQPVPDANLHITLRFLGSLDADGRERAIRAAGQVRRREFSLSLDRAGFWPQPRVLWLGASDVPDPMLGVIADLNTELGGEGFDLNPRPYRPHVTVARGVTDARELPELAPVQWAPEAFVLVRSILDKGGSSYELLESWSLREE